MLSYVICPVAKARSHDLHSSACGSPPGVIVADTLSFNAKVDLVNFPKMIKQNVKWYSPSQV